MILNCLAIDTTSTKLTAVVIKDDTTFCREIEVGKSGHSGLLMPTVDSVLKEAGLSANDLNAVCAVVGPGSFTGIRIGVSAITALAFATGAKRIAVTSFELIAYNNCADVTAAVDAGHGNYYTAHCVNGEVVEASFVSAAEASDIVGKAKLSPDCSYSKALEGVVRKKIADESFVDVLVPYYMRKSQAEREND